MYKNLGASSTFFQEIIVDIEMNEIISNLIYFTYPLEFFFDYLMPSKMYNSINFYKNIMAHSCGVHHTCYE